jgi:hypothetical protein
MSEGEEVALPLEPQPLAQASKRVRLWRSSKRCFHGHNACSYRDLPVMIRRSGVGIVPIKMWLTRLVHGATFIRPFTGDTIAVQLQELMELHKAKPSEDDRWRAFSYGKCKW